MAIIGKIRERSTLLLLVVGGALMAFIVGELFSSRSSIFNNNADRDNIGSIDGVKVRGIDFNNKLETELDNYKTREKTDVVPDFIQVQLREQIWNQYLNDFILNKELDELGIAVSVEELGDMAYGDNPHPQVRKAFTNPETGQFNKNDVINFLKNLEKDETGKTKSQWLVFETAIKEERKQSKYYSMIRNGLYTTSQEAKDYYFGQNKKMNISFVAKRYADLPDSSVVVTEADIEKYYDNNSIKFQEEKSRKLAYAIFSVVPSSLDSADLKEWVEDIYSKFTLTEDDSNFVNANSDNEFDYRYYSRNDENRDIDTSLFIQNVAGFSPEPELVLEGWRMQKISKIKHAPDSVEARHILLSFTKDDKEEILERVDSIKVALEGGANFYEMAAAYSIDPQSKNDSGNLGWFMEGYMIPVINDSCFKADLNKLMLVESVFGIHLIEVTGKSEVVKKLQIATIYRSLEASRQTVDEQFIKANDFSIKLEEEVEMETLANEFRTPYNELDFNENENSIPEIESSRGLIRWAFNAESNEVSEALQYGSTFVVAKLLEIHEDGIAPLENVHAEAEIGALKDKKAEKYLEEMQGFTDLEQAASSLGSRVERADGVVFESFSVPVLGREPNVLGKMYTMNQGDLSVPIKGENGVFIVRIDKVEDAAETSDYSEAQFQLNDIRSSRVDFSVFEALKERIVIVDNRYKIY